jgi:hypothetical protein
MSLIQKLVLTLLPKEWSQAIQSESQSWYLRCPECGNTRSLWEIGGIRYKAYSVRKKALIWCPQCHKFHFMLMEQKINL